MYSSIKHSSSWSESRSVVFDSLRPHGLYNPWNSPGQNTGGGSLSLLQGIFPSQESNQGLLHCRQILYQLSHQAKNQNTGPTLRSFTGTCAVLSHSGVSGSSWPHGLPLTRLLCPWDSPGKNTGVGCHFFLQLSSQSRDRTQVSHIVGRLFTEPPGNPLAIPILLHIGYGCFHIKMPRLSSFVQSLKYLLRGSEVGRSLVCLLYSPIKHHFLLTEVQLTHHVAQVSTVQQRDSVTHDTLNILSHYGSSQGPDCSSLCLTAALSHSPIPGVAAYVREPQARTPSLPQPLPWRPRVFSMSVSLCLFHTEVHLYHIYMPHISDITQYLSSSDFTDYNNF